MTAQFREILTLKGKKYGMVTEPLYSIYRFVNLF